ncbi:DsbA family protein [Deinococcus sp.]|uniref:DsbA family protein n=1 Tax=Deinococcus sp. TaxID=47478 RepID=UPI003B5AD5D8
MTRLQGNSPNRTFLIIGTLVAILLIAATVWAVQRGQTSSTSAAGTQTFDLQGQPFIGQADAPVTLVAFEDFKCPVCKNFEETVLPQIKAKYIDTGKVKFYAVNFPFLAQKFNLNPDDSQLAAQAAECAYDQAGNDGYFGMSSILFRAQSDESQVWASKDKLIELSGSVSGLDPAKMRTCLDDNTTKARVDADEAQANKANVNATPSVFINGKLAATPSDFAALSAEIDAATAPATTSN